jgi:non-ribosomal peptide synthetase component F
MHILVLDIHHIITDGFSNEVLRREFIRLFNNEELPPMRIQYKDFVLWRNSQKMLHKINRQKEYWLNLFEDQIPELKMPLDYKRPAGRSFVGDRVSFIISRKLSRQLNHLAEQAGATLFVVLLTAYCLLISKYSHQEDIVAGTAVTGRNHADLENIVGMFVNLLAIRTRPAGRKSVREFLLEVKQIVIDAMENQDYHFEELVNELGAHGNPARNPLFDVVFLLGNMGTEEVVQQEPGGQVDVEDDLIWQDNPFGFEHKISQFDLLMGAMEINGTIHMTVDYLTALFERTTIIRISEDFVEVLKQIVANDESKLYDILLLHGLEKADSGIVEEFQDEFEF